MHKKIPMAIKLESKNEQEYVLQLCLDIPDHPQVRPGSLLCFSFVRPLNQLSIYGAELISREGDFYKLLLSESSVIGHQVQVTLTVDQAIKKKTDFPYGVYFEQPDGQRLNIQCWQSDTPVFSNAGQYVQGGVEHEGGIDSLLPIPDTITYQSGSFPIDGGFSIALPDFLKGAALVELLDQVVGERLKWVATDESKLLFEIDTEARPDHYQLTVQAKGVVIRGDVSGCRLGLMTLAQLIILSDGVKLKCQVIKDGSDIEYRGVHLDVVRHFFSVEQVKKVLKSAAFYKFNYFHWHLTDDDGWRVESDVLPRLHLEGGWRGPDELLPPQLGSGGDRYGGYYTKSEVRDVVAFASELGVQVVPEMDLPGHARVLTRHFPKQFLDPDDSSEYLSVQHHNDNVINIALPEAWDTLTQLIDEWIDLFPGDLFHLGSDEVPEGAWTQSPIVKELMATEKLPDVAALHGWFLRRVEQYLNERGRTCAGWEELKTGNSVSNESWIYSWQGMDAGLKALSQGHPVVMTPAQFCYLDLAYSDQFDDAGYYWAGTINLQQCLALSKALEPHWRENLKGIQACLWTELVVDEKRLDFMLFPRLIALSQVAWSKQVATEGQVRPRLLDHQRIWSNLGVNYGRSAEFW